MYKEAYMVTKQAIVGPTTIDASVHLKPSDSWVCKCGKTHPLGAYVAAHWDEELLHACDRGRKHSLLRGTLTLIQEDD